MIEDIQNNDFFALFTNNGFENGFKPLIAYQKNGITEISLDELIKCDNPIIPIICYDYKNKIEKLVSKNESGYLINDLILVQPNKFDFIDQNDLDKILKPSKLKNGTQLSINARVSKNEYIKNVIELKKHIQHGDIYEVNYCVEFYAENISMDAFEVFKKYNSISKSPMSCFIKYYDLYILCGSPERFLKHENNFLTSEPIKGTRKRGEDDAEIILELENDQKERSENIMIVDLVRNDLSRVAKKGTVKVDELCKVHTFETVHQSISTISCEIPGEIDFESILNATFPMGSMTGAPKISAMNLIDKFENSKRQIYSGTTGYILPNGDFDLNVLIRTMIYDSKNKYLSFSVGSAITANCDPEKEYEECLIKASAMLTAINGKIV